MAPRSTRTRPAATAEKLFKVMALDGELQPSNDEEEEKSPFMVSMCYFPDGKQMIEGSTDNSIRRWDLQTGKEILEARFVCEREVWAVAVSRDSRWVVAGGGVHDLGELKAWEVETGMMKTFEGHSHRVTCIGVSVDNKLLASGSLDHTARIWDLNTGKLVVGPFKCAHTWVDAVGFSQDSKKLAVKSGVYGRCLEVWDIQEQKLDGRVEKGGAGTLPDTPVFWTTKDRSIVAAFSLEDHFEDPMKIYEFDSSTLETVGAPFEGHTSGITGLALSFDCALLASAAYHDDTIKLWAFESRQLLASFDDHKARTLILSPNSRQLAYTSFPQSGIHICDIPPDILARIWPEQATCSTIAPERPHCTDPLNSHPTRHPATARRNQVSWSSPSPPIRPSRTILPQRPSILHYLRNILFNSLHIDAVPVVRNDEACDPLDFPAASRPLSIHSVQAATQLKPTAAQSISLPPSSTTRTRPRHLSNWWPIRRDHAPLPIVDVPLAQGKLRNAAAGAPKGNDGCIRDEEFDSRPPSPNSDSQGASAPARTDTGEHESGWLCFCL